MTQLQHIWLSSPSKKLSQQGCILAIGNFDGLHAGHKALIQKMQDLQALHDLPTVILTFSPSAKTFFKQVKPLLSLNDKTKALHASGINEVIVFDFNQNSSTITAESFTQHIIIEQLNCQHWVMGADCRFGHQREGSIDWLNKRENPFTCHVVQDVQNQFNQRISSSLLRQKRDEAAALGTG
jgi:riboflavin kinase / FMN adenylyltransferase